MKNFLGPLFFIGKIILTALPTLLWGYVGFIVTIMIAIILVIIICSITDNVNVEITNSK